MIRALLARAAIICGLAFLPTIDLAADVSTGWVQGPGGFYNPADRSGPYSIGSDGVARLRGGPPTGSGNIATAQATAGTTAVQLVAARPGRVAVTIENTGTTPVYVGSSGVTTSTGSLLPGSVGARMTIPTSAAVYGVVGTGTQLVTILETY